MSVAAAVWSWGWRREWRSRCSMRRRSFQKGAPSLRCGGRVSSLCGGVARVVLSMQWSRMVKKVERLEGGSWSQSVGRVGGGLTVSAERKWSELSQ